MRKQICLILILFFISTITGALYSADTPKKPVLYIDQFKNLGQGNDSIGETVKQSLKLIVMLTRKYEIVTADTLPPFLISRGITNTAIRAITLDYIREHSEELEIDEVLYGTFKPVLNGDMVDIQVGVLALVNTNQLFDKKYSAPTDADIFDSLDKIGLDLGGVLSGKKLTLGGLVVSTTVKDAVLYLDGIKSERNRVQMNNAIAGLTHRVEFKNRDGKLLFMKDFEIKEKATYDLTYDFQEFVEVVNLTNTNRMTKKEYTDQTSRAASYSKNGLTAHIGGMGFIWAGYYLDFESFSIEANLTYIPKLPNYSYDHYVAGSLLGTFYIARPDKPFWNTLNFFVKTGVIEMFGISLGFPDYSPFFYFGYGITITPDWSFMPAFMRQWRLVIEVATEQDIGVLWKNFSMPESGITSNNFYRNTGWPLFQIGIKF